MKTTFPLWFAVSIYPNNSFTIEFSERFYLHDGVLDETYVEIELIDSDVVSNVFKYKWDPMKFESKLMGHHYMFFNVTLESFVYGDKREVRLD